MPLHGTNGRHRIYLMRHGAVRYFDEAGKPVNPVTVQLTEEGRAQAAAVGSALSDVPLDRVVCSGLPRTRETATIVCDGRKIDIEDEPALSEIRGGRFTDIPRERIEAEIVYGFEAAAQPGARFAGGELIADFEKRVTDAFIGFLDTPNWTNMLIAAHNGVNRILLGWACGAGLSAVASFEQDMACVNIIDIDLVDGVIIRKLIKEVNLTPYNVAKLGLNHTSMEQVMASFMKRSA